MKSKIIYWLTYAGMWLLALLPLRALYVLSDGLCFLMRHVLHYRRGVVRRNLRNSFPEKPEAELRGIERKFYHYICDYMVEEVKMLRMSFTELCRRMEYAGKEAYLAMIEKHGGIVVLIPHYANFEWLIGMGAVMHEGDVPVQVYKPLRNKYLDELFRHIRARFGGYNVPKHSTAREVVKLRREGRRMAIGLITDQSPNRSEAHYWTRFLNQDTVFMDGAERIAKLTGFPVFYAELERIARGRCKVNFDLLTETPKLTAEGEITELFACRLEQTIRREPAYWFWSHKRWKRVREAPLYPPKGGTYSSQSSQKLVGTHQGASYAPTKSEGGSKIELRTHQGASLQNSIPTTDSSPFGGIEGGCAVVILNWNGCEMLRKFLPSVVKYADGAAVYVADNGSTDNSVEVLRRDFPTVQLILLEKNHGFAEGYNLALRQVEAQYVVLLNSDVEVTEHWLLPLVEYMDTHPEAAACQPKIRSHRHREQFEYAGAAGGFIDRYGYPFCRGRMMQTVEQDRGQYDTPLPVFWATGAALFIRLKDYREAGGLDPRFFAHMEEIDLCWRLRSCGREIACVPQSTVYHVGGGTLRKENPRKTFLNFRNNLLMLYKNLPAEELPHVMRIRTLLDYAAALSFLLKGEFPNAWAVVRARRAYHALRPGFAPSRTENLSRATLTDIPERKPFSLLVQYYLGGKKLFSRL